VVVIVKRVVRRLYGKSLNLLKATKKGKFDANFNHLLEWYKVFISFMWEVQADLEIKLIL
jgi:hypothetical protein